MSEISLLKERLWHAITLEISEEKIKAIIERIKEIDQTEETEWHIQGKISSINDVDINKIYIISPNMFFAVPTYEQLKNLDFLIKKKILDVYGHNACVPINMNSEKPGFMIFGVKSGLMRWQSRIHNSSNVILLLHKKVKNEACHET